MESGLEVLGSQGWEKEGWGHGVGLKVGALYAWKLIGSKSVIMMSDKLRKLCVLKIWVAYNLWRILVFQIISWSWSKTGKIDFNYHENSILHLYTHKNTCVFIKYFKLSFEKIWSIRRDIVRWLDISLCLTPINIYGFYINHGSEQRQ